MYDDWVAESGDTYDHVKLIGSDDQIAAMHWKIVDETFYVAVAANATGWVGFGIAESGGMPGSDIVIFTASDNSLTDTYATAYATPIVDTCQNWDLIDSVVDTDEGMIIFEASRKLNTGDSQDQEIKDDSDTSTPANRVIAAWGDTESYTYHGPQKATSVVRLYKSSTTAKASVLDEYPYVDFTANNYSIPLNDTTYGDFCFFLSNVTESQGFPEDTDVHMVGARFIEDSDSIQHVHHMILYGSKEENNCWAFEMIYAWGPGSDDQVLPPNAGFGIGPNGYKSFSLSIHYDNQYFVPNQFDSSGVRLFYTETLREHNAGILQIGDPFVLLGRIDNETATSPEPDKIGKWQFDCPSTCTGNYIKRGESITVFAEYLHMHEVGVRMISTQYRGFKKVRESSVDYFDFRSSGTYGPVQDPYEIKRFDRFKVSCYYKRGPSGEEVSFGLGSNEEMCITFLWYYPVIEDFFNVCSPKLFLFGEPSCTARSSNKSVGEYDMYRKFGEEPSTCAAVSTPT